MKAQDSTGFNIVINGFLTIDKKNITYLMCYDLFLKDEYEGKMQSKKLSIRYENLNIRFLNQKLKLVRTIFNHEYSDQNLDVFIKMFIIPNLIDKIVYKKNIPIEYKDEFPTIIDDVFTDMNGEVIDIVKNVAMKKEFDEDQKLTTETPYEYVEAFMIKNSETGEIYKVPLLNFSENDKVNMLDSYKDYLNKSCLFKKYQILDKIGYIFIEKQEN